MTRPRRSDLTSDATRQDWSPVELRPVSRARLWVLGVVYWVLLVPLAYVPRHSGNVWSRYMTIESLVERGTLAIDRSPLRASSGSPDVIKVGPHLYSDKPPVLSVLSAGLYFPMFVLGERFSGSVGQFVVVNWVLVMVVVGFSSAVAVVGLRRLLQAAPVGAVAADALALLFGCGSLLLVYGVTFNNHSVAAGLISWSLAEVVLERPGRRDGLGRLVTGFLIGLAAVIDIPAGGAMLVALGAWLAVRSRGVPWLYLTGCAAPLFLHAVVQTIETGSPLPAELSKELLEFQGSYWTTEQGRYREHGPRWWFALELLFGPQGWLTVTPVLAFGLAGLALIARRRGDPLRPAALAVGGVLLVLFLYYVWGVRKTDYAGLSFGVRHGLAVSPACFFFAVVLVARLRSRAAWTAFAVLLGLGTIYAVAGMRDPWSRIERRQDSGLALVKRLTLYPWTSYTRF